MDPNRGHPMMPFPFVLPPGMMPPMTFPPMGYVPPMGMPQMGAMPGAYPFMGPDAAVRDMNVMPVGVKSSISVWIGRIGLSVTEKHMHALLDVIGEPYTWKRVPDPRTGKRKLFGFAEWSTPRGAILSQRLLNNLQVGESQLSVKVDEKTQQMLNEASEDPANHVSQDDEKKIGEHVLQVSAEICRELKSSGTLDAVSVPSRPEDFKEDYKEKERRRDAEKKLHKIKAHKERQQYRLEQDEKEYLRIERELFLDQKKFAESVAASQKCSQIIAARLELIHLQNDPSFDTHIPNTSEDLRIRRHERDMDAKEDEDDERRRLRDSKISEKKKLPDGLSRSSNTSANSSQENVVSTSENDVEDNTADSSNAAKLNVRVLLSNADVQSRVLKSIGEAVFKYLDEEEEDLVNFVYNCLLEEKTLEEITELLRPVLEEDASAFIDQVWQVVLQEHEAACDSVA